MNTLRLDYCNALLAGPADSKWKHLGPIQSVQNTAAQLVSGARPYVTNSTQSQLASNTSASHLQDRPARVEVCPWYCSCRNFESRSKTSEGVHSTVCIYSMYHLWGRQRDSDFSVPWAVNLEQFAINSVRSCWVVCLWQRSKCGWRHIPSIINNNEHYPALLGRFVVVVPSIKLMFSFIYIYLFTYAFDSKTCSCDGDRTFTGAEPRVWARPTHH